MGESTFSLKVMLHLYKEEKIKHNCKQTQPQWVIKEDGEVNYSLFI